MSQVANFQVPAHPSGIEMRTQLNQIVLALLTQNAGPVEPVQMHPLMMWGDTTARRLRMRNSTNDAWVDLGPIDDFLADIRRLVTETAALKVNRTGDTMTGDLTMQWRSIFFNGSAGQSVGRLGPFDNGLGFVNSAGNAWNFQVNDDGTVHCRGTFTVNEGVTVLGGRLQLRQNGGAQHGEIAMFSTDGTVMFMRGRAGGGGMEWVNNDYNNVPGSLDNNGTFQVTGDLVSGNGNGRVSGVNGDLFGTVWGGWLSNFIGNRAIAGAQVQWNSGINEFAQWTPGAEGTYDAPAPWVLIGTRTINQFGWIWSRAILLRNQ